jgi:hypothetical protein
MLRTLGFRHHPQRSSPTAQHGTSEPNALAEQKISCKKERELIILILDDRHKWR